MPLWIPSRCSPDHGEQPTYQLSDMVVSLSISHSVLSGSPTVCYDSLLRLFLLGGFSSGDVFMFHPEAKFIEYLRGIKS